MQQPELARLISDALRNAMPELEKRKREMLAESIAREIWPNIERLIETGDYY